MKVYLTDEENEYIYRLIIASAAFYQPYVQAFEVLKDLSKKTVPPRSYMNLNQTEKSNIAGLVKKTVEAVDKEISQTGEDEKKKEGLEKQKSLLNSVLTKMDLATEVVSL